ncbi:MAG: phosphatidylserine decarboxylase family protein [Bacteroidales bacterium]
MHIHKEGYRVILYCFFILLVLNIIFVLLPLTSVLAGIIRGLSLILLFMVIRFFRVPSRNALLDELNILSPADGKVVAIEQTTEDEFFKDKRIQISIFMSIWNVHVNWHPISGTVEYFKHHPGQYLIAKNPKSSLKNERTSIAIKKDEDKIIMVRQIAGAVARRIVSYINPGASVNQASQIGIIKFGSRVDLFLPLNIRLNVKLKDSVKGQSTILAQWRK